MAASIGSLLVTGANRGIGLGFVKRFLQLDPPPFYVFATFRCEDSSQELLEIATRDSRVYPIQLDIRDHDKFKSVRKEIEDVLQGQGLNLLINNVGVMDRSDLRTVTAEKMRYNYEVNALSPVLLSKALLPLLKTAAAQSTEKGLCCARAAVINVSSRRGSCELVSNMDYYGVSPNLDSIDGIPAGSEYAYRMSKAALNVATVSMAVDLEPFGILASALHPGYVATDMTKHEGDLSVEESVRGMVDVIQSLDEHNCKLFHDYKNNVTPW